MLLERYLMYVARYVDCSILIQFIFLRVGPCVPYHLVTSKGGD